jgi:hypothetical protein
MGILTIKSQIKSPYFNMILKIAKSSQNDLQSDFVKSSIKSLNTLHAVQLTLYYSAYRKINCSRLIIGLVGDQTMATCMAFSSANHSAIHYDSFILRGYSPSLSISQGILYLKGCSLSVAFENQHTNLCLRSSQ